MNLPVLLTCLFVCIHQVHNSRSCEDSVYSCPRALSLFFPNEEEIHISGYQVHQGGRRCESRIKLVDFNERDFISQFMIVSVSLKNQAKFASDCRRGVHRAPGGLSACEECVRLLFGLGRKLGGLLEDERRTPGGSVWPVWEF